MKVMMTHNKFLEYVKTTALVAVVFFGVFFYYSILIQGCDSGSMSACIFLLK